MTSLRRSVPLFTLAVLAMVVGLLAGWTSPDWTIPFCERMGGRMEARPMADGGMMNYCVFADGTECSAGEIHARTCKLPAAVAPSSPLAPSNGDILNTSPLVGLPPWSLNELVEDAPLIVIGEVGPGQPAELFPYDENWQPVTVDAFNSPIAGMPGTDFLLNIEQVIRDDGVIARGGPVILRELGEHTAALKKLTAGTDYESTYTGDRYLFLLHLYPEGRIYGLYHGVWSRLLIDGDILRISGGARPPLQVAGSDQPITLDQFIQYVESQDSQAARSVAAPAGQPPAPSWLVWLIGFVERLLLPGLRVSVQ